MRKVFYIILWAAFFLPDVHTFSKKFLTALDKASYEIAELSLPANVLEYLIEYIEFYASWYAPVTPATKELYDALPKEALVFVEKIKRIAQPLQRKGDRRKFMGASRLTNEGKFFYENVIAYLRKKLPVTPY